MSRKSKIVTLTILGAIAAFGMFACCCTPWFDRDEDKDKKDGGGGRGGHARRTYGPRWFPIFFGGGGAAHGAGGAHTGGTSSGTGRGGFGGTGGHSGGGIGA